MPLLFACHFERIEEGGKKEDYQSPHNRDHAMKIPSYVVMFGGEGLYDYRHDYR